MKRKIRWGVIGSGGIAKRRTIPEGILPAENAELVSVCSLRTESCREVAEKFGAKACGSIAELLKTDIDAVYIATPVHQHVAQVRQSAAAGKHVFCEKPLGMNTAEAKEILRICKKAKVKLGTAFMMRYHTQHQAALRMVKAGRIGKPAYARAQLSCWYPPVKGAWRQYPKQSGGGSLIDMGGHCLDLLETFFGPIEAVSCATNRNIHKYQSEDSAAVVVRFRNGALGTVDCFFCVPDYSSKNRLELYGSKGSILAQGTIGQGSAAEMTAFLEGAGPAYDPKQARDASGGLVIAPEPMNVYRAEIEAFSDAIVKGRSTAESAEAGLRSQVVLDACYKSAKTGKEVKV